MFKSLPRDIEDNIIPDGISHIPSVENIYAPLSEWTPIYIQTEETKKIIMQPREDINWKYATVSGGNFFTFKRGAALQASICTTSGILLGWVQPSDNVIMEILIGA